jgi:exonuclease III
MRGQRGAGAPRQLVLTSINIQKGGTPAKLAAALNAAAAMGSHVVFLQETGTCGDPRSLLRGAPGAAAYSSWKGAAYHSPGSPHARGCLTLIRTCPLLSNLPPPGQARTDAHGRIVRVDCNVGGQPATLINVYAPAAATAPERRAFFEELQTFVPTDRLAIVGGDFNCVLDLRLDTTHAGPASQRAAGSDGLRALMTAAGLADVWRAQHPQRVQWTHWNEGAASGARLDLWLFPAAQLANWEASCSIKERGHGGIRTDHHPIELCLLPPGQPPRPLRPRPQMPLEACDMPAFRQGAQALLATALQRLGLRPLGEAGEGGEAAPPGPHQPPGAAPAAEQAPAASAIEVWASLKPRLLTLATFQSRERRKALRQREAQLARAAARARREFAAAQGDAGRKQAWLEATAALLSLWEEQLQRTRSSSSVLHQLYGDASTYYYHSFFSTPHAPTTITQLRPGPQRSPNSPAVSLLTEEGMQQAFLIAEAHFSDPATGVLRAHAHDDAVAAQLHAALPRRLSPTWATAAEGPDGSGRITGPELRRAVRAAQRGRTAGPDGLPYEFYATFWSWLEPLLTAAFNEAFCAADGSATALATLLTAAITLVYKGKGKPADHLSGFRPISLLNCDVKLLCKVLADRAQLPLDQVVDLTQSAFICDRDISDSVQYHLGLAEWLQHKGHPLYLVLADLAGAYDSVSWPFLFSTLRALGFQELGLVRWAQLLHCGSRACVLINGHSSPYFELRGGLAQGSGLSPLLWTAVAQTLTAQLNRLAAQGRIQPPALPDGTPAPAVQAYADDNTLVSTEPDTEVPAIMAAFAAFTAAGGPALSVGPLGKTTLACVVDAPSLHCPSITVLRAQPQAPQPAAPGPPLAAPAAQAAAANHAPDAAVAEDAAAQPAAVAAAAAAAEQHQPRTAAQQAATATAQDTLIHGPSQLPAELPGRGNPPRLLGIPVHADAETAARHAFANSHGKLGAAAAQWPASLLSLEGRVLLAKQRLCSKLLYPLAHLRMAPEARTAAQRTLRTFVRGGSRPVDGAQAGMGGGLHPAERTCALPPRLGGLGHPLLQLCEASLHAKWPALAFSHRRHPWKQLMQAAFSESDAEAGLPTWPVTLASAPPAARAPLLQRLSPRLRSYVTSLASTGLHRLPDPSPSFFSVMAEPLFHNPQLTVEAAAGPRDAAAEPPPRLLLRPADLPEAMRPRRTAGGQWQGWRYVRDVWLAARGPLPLPQATAAGLATVEAALPAAWRQHLAAPAAPEADWVCCTGADGATYALQGPHPPAGLVGPPADLTALLQANEAGRLRHLFPDSVDTSQPLPADIQLALAAAAAALTDQPWQPALVLSAPKHRGLWTQADWALSNTAATPPDSQGQVNLDDAQPREGEEPAASNSPTQLWLLGPWATAPLDPSTWGHGSKPLHGYTARLGRSRVTVLDAWAEKPKLALPGGHAPKLWPPPVGSEEEAGHERGLAALEARWTTSAAARMAAQPAPPQPASQRHASQAEHDAALQVALQREAPWARASHVPQPRPGPAERAAARAQRQHDHQLRQGAAAPGTTAWDDTANPLAALEAELNRQQPLPGQPEPPLRPWLRLWRDTNVEREHRATAWRILHGGLMCNALRLHLMPQRPHGEGLCAHPQCQQAGALETLSHAFLDCPAIAPALDWLLQLWAALTPGQPQPPRSALLLLADWRQDWSPSPDAADLWALLRVTFLGCAWHLRCQRAGGRVWTAQQHALTVAASVVAFVREAIRRDWARVESDVRLLSAHMPSRHFRGRNPELTLAAFRARWCSLSGLLCDAREGGQLHLRLTCSAPVPVPHLPPGGAWGADGEDAAPPPPQEAAAAGPGTGEGGGNPGQAPQQPAGPQPDAPAQQQQDAGPQQQDPAPNHAANHAGAGPSQQQAANAAAAAAFLAGLERF